MVQTTQSVMHARDLPRIELLRAQSASRATTTEQTRERVALSLHHDLVALEQEWRAFETTADCTPFQTFDWLSAWQRHIGDRSGVMPALVIGRDESGILFLLPFGVEPDATIRRLTWLGQELGDYNAPLLAPAFRSVTDFPALWRRVRDLLQADPLSRHDLIALEKMPDTVGAQPNPFVTALDVMLNPSGAYQTELGDNWETFYTGKRSSATRRRDRTKVKRLGEMGAVRFVDVQDTANTAEVAQTLDTLIHQKARSFARMGVPNMFARAGYPEFFRDLVTSRRTRGFAHISRLDVGDTWAATNFGLAFRGCYYYILASYDDGEVSRFGPGAAHLRELLQRSIRVGLTRFDFTIGDEPYKREWCDTEQTLYDHVAAASLRGWPVMQLSMARRGLKRTIKHNAFLWSMTLKLRAALGAFKRRREPAAPEQD